MFCVVCTPSPAESQSVPFCKKRSIMSHEMSSIVGEPMWDLKSLDCIQLYTMFFLFLTMAVRSARVKVDRKCQKSKVCQSRSYDSGHDMSPMAENCSAITPCLTSCARIFYTLASGSVYLRCAKRNSKKNTVTLDTWVLGIILDLLGI